MQEKKYIQHFDVARSIMYCFVIGIHVVGKWIHPAAGKAPTADWLFASYLDSIFRCCIPIFCMITGALLFRSEKSTSVAHTLKVKIPRVLFPTIFWSLVYIVFFSMDHLFARTPNMLTLKYGLMTILNGPMSVHLWYMYMLIAFYIISPLLSLFVRSASRNVLRYCLVVWLIFSCLLPFAGQINSYFVLSSDADLSLLSGYAGYFILGYYLETSKRKINTAFCSILFILGCNITVWGEYLFKHKLPDIMQEPFTFYFSPNVLICAITAYFIIKNTVERHPLKSGIFNAVHKFSSIGIGIYFCHELIRIYIQRHILASLSPIAIMAVNLPATLIISAVIAFIASKIPFVNRYLFGIEPVRKKNKF